MKWLALVVVVCTGCSWLLDSGENVGVGGCPRSACEALGGACQGELCELECVGQACMCPPNASCRIEVRSDEPAVRVDCVGSVDCRVRCTGDWQCEDLEVDCGSGACDVDCTVGVLACLGLTVRCGSGACNVSCVGNGNCQGGGTVRCGSAEACTVDCRDDACDGLRVSCEQAQVCTATCDPDGNNTCNGALFTCDESTECELDCANRPGAECS